MAAPGADVSGVIGGKYRILRKLGAGGMGEVFLARQTGLAEFEKLVVLKSIFPHLAEEEEFVRMFLDEARIAADLRHPNIVTVFEVLKEGPVQVAQGQAPRGGTFWIAMEYLHGQDLKQVRRALSEKEVPLPLAHAVRIVLDVAAGLHYAHGKVDLSGKPLGIVHRDVSPQNVLVTFDGVAKILDFGIARARTRTSQTDAGLVRGKASYMSPEQAVGSPLDHRSDQFSLGTILWELTTGKRLFSGEDPAKVMEQVARASIPRPSQVVPDYPPALEPIVLKALAQWPEDRFGSCQALAFALEELMASERLLPSAGRLAAFLVDLFGKEASGPVELPPEPPSSAVAGHSATLPASGAAPGNLPSDRGGFVGRQKDLEAVAALFASGSRLVTLTGPGGMGKSRLALKSGHAWMATEVPRPPVWFCELTQATDADGISSRVGAALGVPLLEGKSEDAVEKLGAALSSRGKALLILDNFEQAVGHAAATVGRWLDRAPALSILVTSQERLRLDSEACYELTPLGLPESTAEAGGSEAVALFLQRARLANTNFQAGEPELKAIVEIVRALDGIPLAIELAAARVAVLSPAKILERLPRRLDLLTAGRRDAASRHATLRGAIDWSWSLLREDEREALALASIFEGGFSLEAAEAVLDVASGAPPLDLLQSLVDKSLLRTQRGPVGGEARFGLYHNIREYAGEKLAASSRREAIESRHAAYYLRTAAVWAAAIDGPDGLECLKLLTLEMENLAAIFRRYLARRPDPSPALHALVAMEPVLSTRGPFAQLVTLLEAAVKSGEESGAPPALLGTLYEARGRALRDRGGLEESVRAFQLALEKTRMAGDRSLEARVLSGLGLAEWRRGRFEESRRRQEEALAMARLAGAAALEGEVLGRLGILEAEAGDPVRCDEHFRRGVELVRSKGAERLEAVMLRNHGRTLHQRGELEAAKLRYQRALTIYREWDQRTFEGNTLGALGSVLLEEGKLEEAERALKSAIEVHAETGNRWARGIFLVYLGMTCQLAGRADQAGAAYRESLSLLKEAGDRRTETLCLAYYATMDALAGAWERADKTLGEAREAFRTMKAAPESAVVEILSSAVAAARHGQPWKGELAPEARDQLHRSEDVRYALALAQRIATARRPVV